MPVVIVFVCILPYMLLRKHVQCTAASVIAIFLVTELRKFFFHWFGRFLPQLCSCVVTAGPRSATTLSFASIMSASVAGKTSDEAEVKMNGLGKRGKKASRVLLSTAGGRRY